MKSFVSHAAHVCIFLTTALVTVPVIAGEARAMAAGHKGSSISQRGVASFHRSQRDLPNGVSIFNRRNHASHLPVKKRTQRKHARNSGGGVKSRSKSHYHSEEKKRAGNGSHRRESRKRPKRKDNHHKKPRLVYGTTVYVAPPADEYVYAQDRADENCRYLTERGYDRTGRRVLVEWTLCFDDQGTAYVPADGRRILARY